MWNSFRTSTHEGTGLMAQALALSFIDQLCQASRERPTQIIDLIIPIYMPGTLSEHSLEFLTHGVYAATFLQGVLSKKTPGPCHRCFVQEKVRNVRWLAARVVTCHGAKAVLPARLLVVADNVASRRLEKAWSPVRAQNPGQSNISSQHVLEHPGQLADKFGHALALDISG